MIDEKTKQKIIKELEKYGNVWVSCLKVNISRSTYYRWKKNNKTFQKLANNAERQGRENMCDIAEHALLQNVKEKKMDAIKYVLNHNSNKYRKKQVSNVIIVHKKDNIPETFQQKTLEDLLQDNKKSVHEYGLELYEKFTKYGDAIPNKPDGKTIKIDELPSYETYIENWQENKRKEKERKRENEKNRLIADKLDDILNTK